MKENVKQFTLQYKLGGLYADSIYMGFSMVYFDHDLKDMSPLSKEMFKLLMEENIIYGGNPVLKWMAGNVVMCQNPAGNIKPDKENEFFERIHHNRNIDIV